jgi:hypothetical protein
MSKPQLHILLFYVENKIVMSSTIILNQEHEIVEYTYVNQKAIIFIKEHKTGYYLPN